MIDTNLQDISEQERMSVIDYSGNRTIDYGRVYFGNYKFEVPETGYIVMSLIANSFSEFLAKLYVYEDK